ncbi:MAG: efflux RND transporter periplasmic adaptor subunit, partial [Bacteroidota bacterium]
MKTYITLILALLIVVSCGPKSEVDPSDLDGLRKVLSEKKKELSTLQEEIASLTDEVAELDPSLQEKATLVDSTTLLPTQFERYIDIQGIVVADQTANVVSEVPGRITQLTVKEGDRVTKGQLIATLDLESLDKQVAEIETSLSLAQDVYERQSRLWEQNIGSEVQYLQAKNNVERLEKSLETLAFQKTKANVYCPITGVVDQEFMKQGEVANAGMPILQILNTSNLKITTDLPERYLKMARRGATVRLRVPSLDLEGSGRITMLGRSIDAANRTLELEIKPNISSSLLKPNLLTEIKLKELEIEDALFIP